MPRHLEPARVLALTGQIMGVTVFDDLRASNPVETYWILPPHRRGDRAVRASEPADAEALARARPPLAVRRALVFFRFVDATFASRGEVHPGPAALALLGGLTASLGGESASDQPPWRRETHHPRARQG